MIESEEGDININENITVKFKVNDYQTVVQVYPKRSTIQYVLNDISEKFQVASKYLKVYHDSNAVPVDIKLFEICHNEYQIIDLTLVLSELATQFNQNVFNESDKIQLDCNIYYQHYQLPDFFSVYVPEGDNGEVAAKRLIVEIINKPIVKPFLGGYIHTKTLIEYHDAFTQTGPLVDEEKMSRLVTRDSQTAELRSMGAEPTRERALQAFGHAASLIQTLTSSEYFITAKKYKSFDEICRESKTLQKIILIQRNFRRYLLERLIKNSAAEWRRLYGEQRDREDQRREKMLNRFKQDCVVKAFPRTKSDFDVLFAEVQKWKESEITRINEMYSDGPRIAELNLLLEREINLLNGIEKQRSKVRKYLKDLLTEKELDEMGAPIKWIGYRDMVCEIDLLRTQHVRRLINLYRHLKTPMAKGERIKFISHLYDLLSAQPDLPVALELAELIEREKKLIAIGINDDAMESLRNRQNSLFVAFIKGMKVEKPKEIATKMCSKCKIVRSTTEFELHTRQEEVNICKSCIRLKAAAIDVSLYRAVLRAIRRDERKRNSLSSSAFIVQEEDIREIMETIWHGCSVLSQCDIRKELRLPRWNKALDWSPWNCVCLTESETIAHLKVVNLDQVYDANLIRFINIKHELAKTVFSNLKSIDTDFVESGNWWNVGVAQKVV